MGFNNTNIFKHKDLLYCKLSEYLQSSNINIYNNFKCPNNSNHKHSDKNFSAKYYSSSNKIYCFTCNKYFDIFNMIEFDYGLCSFKEQYEKLCIIYSLDDEVAQYTQNKQEIQSVINMNDVELKKKQKFNNFYCKLADKKKDFTNVLNLIENKNLAISQDLQFKIEFIDRFLNNNLEYNNNSLENIKNFNKNYELEYNNFRKYFLEIM